MAAVKTCAICGYFVKYRKGTKGTGRGYGFAQGGKAIAEMRRHVRDCHPEYISDCGRDIE